MPIYSRPDEDEEIIDINEEINVPEDAPQEEKTFAKRYGDLRRYMQREVTKRDRELEDLKLRLQNSSALSLPDEDNDAAIDAWVQNHPQIARIVMGLADRRANAANEGLASRLAELDEKEKKLNQEAAYAKVNEKHPDFFSTIRHEAAFHDWLSQKSARMQDAIYGDDNDWRAAIDVITLYKTENGVEPEKPKKQERVREAAEHIPARGTSTPSGQGRVKFTESQIQRMSAVEYERNEAAIAEAWKNNEVLRDLSAGAR